VFGLTKKQTGKNAGKTDKTTVQNLGLDGAKPIEDRTYQYVALLSFAVVGLLAVFFLRPRILSFFALQTELAASEQSRGKLQNKLDFIESFNTADFHSSRTVVDTVLPSTKPFLSLFYSLEKLANDNSVLLVGISAKPGEVATDEAEAAEGVASSKTLRRFPLEIKVRGTSTQLQVFFDSLHTVAPALDVRSVSLNSQPVRDLVLPDGNSQGTAEDQTAGDQEVPQGEQYLATVTLDSLYAPLAVKISDDDVLTPVTSDEEAFVSALSEYKTYSIEDSAIGQDTQVGKTNLFTY